MEMKKNIREIIEACKLDIKSMYNEYLRDKREYRDILEFSLGMSYVFINAGIVDCDFDPVLYLLEIEEKNNSGR